MLICLMTASCLGVNTIPKLEHTEFPLHPLERPTITLGPGDVIEVKYRFWPELNEIQTVRHDGNISLQLIDEVQVAGLTPEKLDEHLTKLYEKHLKDPVLTVIVRSQADQRVYIGGAVKTPGVLPINGNMTALEAIMIAGGFDTTTAAPKNVVLIQNIGEKRYASLLDLENAFYKPESDPYFLGPNDMLFVPRKMIVKLNDFVAQYITGLMPPSFTATNTTQKLKSTNTIGFRPNSGGSFR
ncbi:polysaccharide biosynthesis/export family protein [Candidatus Scalindua japonica]|nr:polysaccharide biosynthesis/export family protein [Candidatus Scalindua japonica]